MSDYRRLISYIYAYEAQDKGKNVGFAKLEARNGQCKITINVKRIFMGGSDLEVFLLAGETEVSLGKLYVRNGIGEFHALVNFDDVEQSGFGMPQINGLIIHGQDNSDRYYMTIWEDVGIQAAQLNTNVPETPRAIIEQALEKPSRDKTNIHTIRPAPTNKNVKIEDDLSVASSYRGVNGELEELTPLKPEFMPDTIPVNQPELFPQEVQTPEPVYTPQTPQTQPEVYPDEVPVNQPVGYTKEPSADKIFNETEGLLMEGPLVNRGECEKIYPISMVEEIPPEYPENSIEEVGSDGQAEEKTDSGEPLQPTDDDENMQSTKSLEQEVSDNYNESNEDLNRTLWDKLSRRYPKIQAFDYEPGCEILTIKPQDIGLLPRDIWFYGNNSFLLHGYYNYRYLILAKLMEKNGEQRYLLGVPGQFNNNEKYMASMFGFTDFVLAKRQTQKDGKFGYWYRDIRL